MAVMWAFTELWRSGGAGKGCGEWVVEGLSTVGRVMRRRGVERLWEVWGNGGGIGGAARGRREWGSCAGFQETRGRFLENGDDGGELRGMGLGEISSYPEATVTATECK